MKTALTIFLSIILFSAKSQHILFCKTYGQFPEAVNSSFYIDNILRDYGGCTGAPALHLVIIDSADCEPWGTFYNNQNTNHQFGNINNNGGCRQRVEYFFAFGQNDSIALLSLDSMLNTSVPDGFSVLIYTWQYANYDSWNNFAPNLFSTLQGMGMNSVGINDSMPFIFYVQKGNISSAQEVYGININDSIQLTANLTCSVTGIIKEILAPDYALFPNPVTNKAMLKFDNPAKNNLVLTLYSSYGSCVREMHGITGSEVEIEKQNLNPGLYFFRLQFENKIITKGKFIVR